MIIVNCCKLSHWHSGNPEWKWDKRMASGCWDSLVGPTRCRLLAFGMLWARVVQNQRPQQCMISECSRCVAKGTYYSFIPPFPLNFPSKKHSTLHAFHKSNRAHPFHTQTSWSLHWCPRLGWLNSRNDQSVLTPQLFAPPSFMQPKLASFAV